MNKVFNQAAEGAARLARHFYTSTDYHTAREATAILVVAPLVMIAAGLASPLLAFAGLIGGSLGGGALGHRLYQKYNPPQP